VILQPKSRKACVSCRKHRGSTPYERAKGHRTSIHMQSIHCYMNEEKKADLRFMVYFKGEGKDG